ncbi:MAG TPA: CPBP family intramembrane metalloprotease [Anaerolineae bacterium]|nr:CPBP family intramembrane metalloprotease [Anaerolineae bacterium]HQI86749.1 CPBP family intramembrane metalloprotease [Anaerolineae bacterium]
MKQTSLARFLTIVVWGVILCVSHLPNVLWYEIGGGIPAWLPWAKIGLAAVLAAAAFFWKPLRPLCNFFLILLAIFVIEELVSRLTDSALWQGWFDGPGAAFTMSMLDIQLGRLIVSLLVIAVLLFLGYRRADFFLVRGQLAAPITPVRWLGFPKPDPWTRFGGQFALYISLGTLLFLILGGRPSAAALVGALPMLPAVLLFAAMNAFNEEMTYRASLLAGLEPAIGPQHALWSTAFYFGIGHYFGVPYGVIGAVMASFLGWMMGKAMLETRGFFWAWFIHFWQDVLIFSFMAMGSITPGGS